MLRFHLERQTGGLTRDIERGTRGISTLLSFMVFSVLPTLLEIALVTGFLIYKFDIWFGVITVARWSLRLAHVLDLRVAHRAPRTRTRWLEGQNQGRRLAAQLRDREVLRTRAGRPALRREPGAYEKAVVTSETRSGC